MRIGGLLLVLLWCRLFSYSYVQRFPIGFHRVLKQSSHYFLIVSTILSYLLKFGKYLDTSTG